MPLEIIISIVTGLISSATTIIVLKTDMKWIKEVIDKHDKRIYNIETGNICPIKKGEKLCNS